MGMQLYRLLTFNMELVVIVFVYHIAKFGYLVVSATDPLKSVQLLRTHSAGAISAHDIFVQAIPIID